VQAVPSRPMPSRTRWPAVAVGIVAGVVAAAFVGKLPGALPALSNEFGLSLVMAGWVVSMFNALAVVTAVFFGFVADRVGALRSCLAGLAALVLGGAAGALAPSTEALLVSRFVEGAGFIAVGVSAPALIASAAVGRDRGLALGIWSAYMPFGFAVTLVATPFVLAATGWRGLWWITVAAAAGTLAALWHMRAQFPLPPPRTERTFASIAQALRQPGAWWCALAMCFYAFQWTAVMVWLPTFLVKERGLSMLAGSMLTALVVGVNVPGNLLGTWLLQRGVPRGKLISLAAFLMGASGAVLFASGLSDAVRYAACLALSFGGGMTPPAVLTSSQFYARAPGQIASLQGLIVQLSNFGQFVGPPAFAAVVSATGGWDATGSLLVTAACGAFIAGQLVARTERRLAAERTTSTPIREA
jgi:MFS transporter, CP family, cyanate transporter